MKVDVGENGNGNNNYDNSCDGYDKKDNNDYGTIKQQQ